MIVADRVPKPGGITSNHQFVLLNFFINFPFYKTTYIFRSWGGHPRWLDGKGREGGSTVTLKCMFSFLTTNRLYKYQKEILFMLCAYVRELP